ncbi:hypothetical protein ACLB2K_030430 [Fragaria x ananassa]
MGSGTESSKVNDVQTLEVSVKNSESGSFGGAKLNGTNFRKWKKIMTAHLRGMHKMRHVTGTIKAPSESDVDAYTKWEDDDEWKKVNVVENEEEDNKEENIEDDDYCGVEFTIENGLENVTLVLQRVMLVPGQRHNIFRSSCSMNSKPCEVIIHI